MATTLNLFKLGLLFGLLFITSLDFTAGQVGVTFGRQANNLPSVQRTIALYKKYNIQRMRLHDPHPPTLRALGGTGIRLMLGVADADIQEAANCPQFAASWVRRYVLSYPNITFRYIAVGNGIAPESTLAPFVLPAMQNIYRAIRAARLGGQIKVSTAINQDLLNTTFPPQAGEFKCSVNWYIRPIVEFLRDTRTVLLANVFPFLAYLNDMQNINQSFALLQPNSGVVYGGVYYDNLYYVILDAVEAAMERILAAAPSLFSVPSSNDNKEGINGDSGDVGGASTGQATMGGEHKPGYSTGLNDGPINTVENARIYNNNLMRIVKTGTPRKPTRRLQPFILSMFDENLRPGPAYERHFGIFLPNGQPKYPLRFS